MEGYLVQVQPGDLRAEGTRPESVLGACPDFQRPGSPIERGRIHWFERSVCEVRHLVEPLDDVAPESVSSPPHRDVGLGPIAAERRDLTLTQAARRDCSVRASVERWRQRI